MAEHPIIFSGRPMVRAILDGRKTVTRRVVRFVGSVLQSTGCYGPDGFDTVDRERHVAVRRPWSADMIASSFHCPYGTPGDRLWVRETWGEHPTADGGTDVIYAADYTDGSDRAAGAKYRPSIHMPRWASRLTLEVVDVRVEQLQEITRGDAVAEGVSDDQLCTAHATGLWDEFRALWDSINAKRGFPWESNPWVWRIEFRQAGEVLHGE